MKTYEIFDVTGKVPLYDHTLCDAIQKIVPILFVTPYRNKDVIPSYKIFYLLGYFNNKPNARKIFKAIEALINYVYYAIHLLLKHPNVVHIQWLPFLEYTAVEIWVLRLFRYVSPTTKFLLTQHNLYPHNYPEDKKDTYRRRFTQISNMFDKIIVHTESSKRLLIKNFNIAPQKIEVIYHGVFMPKIKQSERRIEGKIRLLMFGVQSKYKGTDLLVDAVSKLPEPIREKIDVTIAGKTEQSLFDNKKEKAYSLGIKWSNRFFEEEELHQLIADSDILLFPYRNISQSGALLLGLGFRKPMIVSRLPSFVETLGDFVTDAFIDVDSVDSLCQAIIDHVNNKIDIERELDLIDDLQDKYSWLNTAKKTVDLYNNL